MMIDTVTWRSLINEYGQLRQLVGHTPQSRGRRFNEVIASTLRCWGIEAVPGVRTTGEQDVVFTVAGTRFILEAKWERKKTDTTYVAKLQKRVRQGISGTHGVFLSMSGYSKEAILDVANGERNEVLLFDASHWEAMLSGLVPPAELIELARDQASFRSRPYCSLADLLKGTAQATDTINSETDRYAGELIRSALPGVEAEIISTDIQSNHIGLTVNGLDRILITTLSAILELDPSSQRLKVVAPISDCHRGTKVLNDGSILFSRRSGVGRFHKKAINILAGGAVGNTHLMEHPDGSIWLFDNGSIVDTVAASAIKIGLAPGDEEFHSVDYPPSAAQTSIWLDSDKLLTVGGPSFSVGTTGTSSTVRREARQSNPMGLIHLGGGIIASTGDSVSIGLTDIGTWDYCEVAQLNLSASITDLVKMPDGTMYIAASYPASRAGNRYAIARLKLPQHFQTALASDYTRGLVAELSEWQTSEPLQSPATGIPELQAQISALTVAKFRETEREMEFRRDVSRAFDRLKESLSVAFHALQKHLHYFSARYYNDVTDALQELWLDRSPLVALSWGGQFFPPGGWPGPMITISIGMRVTDVHATADIVGLFRVDFIHDNVADQHVVWKGVYNVGVGSEQENVAVADVREGFLGGFEEALRLTVRCLS